MFNECKTFILFSQLLFCLQPSKKTNLERRQAVMNNTTKLVYLLGVSGLASRVAAQVAAEKAAKLENRPTTYNNTSIPDNAKALHKYFMAKNQYRNMSDKQRWVCNTRIFVSRSC
jgi:hypothetical protein